MREPLPIDDVLPAIVDELQRHRRVVVEAPPGAGKSTRVPQAILDAGVTNKQIVMLEPRRVAARAIAARIAAERSDARGAADAVGYQIRWERRGGPHTRLWVLTEGILTRRVLGDPFLDDIGVLILDEFHERSIHTDLALGFAREIADLRDDFAVVVMSATLDAAKVATYLGCNSVASDGRLHPVRESWASRDPEDLPAAVRSAIVDLVNGADDDGGDILVFLPGLREIDACREACARLEGFELHRLHGQLPDREQDAALSRGARRKIVFATNIAETSLTIPGVTAVIDSGLVRIARADPSTGFDRLETAQTSLASARQRAGRAGRTAPGRAVRLWPHASEFRRREFDEPEVARIDLCGAVLDVMRWSGAAPEQFPWYEPPPAAPVAAAIATLESVGALDDGSVTAVGERISDMPLHPRVARFLVAAESLEMGQSAAIIAACVSEADWVTRVSRDASPVDSDVLLRAELLELVADGRTVEARAAGLDVSVAAARSVLRVARDLTRWVTPSGHASLETVARALVEAFGDRVAFRASDERYALPSGGSLVLGRESLVRDADIVVATSVFGTTRADGVECAIARQVTAVRREWLPAARFSTSVEVRFDPELDRLVARRIERYGALVLRESPAALADATADDETLARALAQRVATDLVRAFALEKDELRYLQRIDFARRSLEELDLPDPRDVDLLVQLCWGARSFADLRRTGLCSAYRRHLDRRQIAALDREVPDRYPLGGRSFRIDYSNPDQPVLAARIQDFFGQRTTPTIANGRVKLTLHLLAPNQRPQQVTQDLESFWSNTYAEVRKELRARYPKHDWPEDPNR